MKMSIRKRRMSNVFSVPIVGTTSSVHTPLPREIVEHEFVIGVKKYRFGKGQKAPGNFVRLEVVPLSGYVHGFQQLYEADIADTETAVATLRRPPSEREKQFYDRLVRTVK